MSNDSTQNGAGEAGKSAKSKDIAAAPHDSRAMLDALGRIEAAMVADRRAAEVHRASVDAELAALRADLAAARSAAEAAATAADEAATYMRVLLPERYLSLKVEEVLQLHERTPEARLKLTADFVTGMVTMRRGEVIDAGDPRIRTYCDRMQLALVVGGEEAAERVDELVAQANARQVKAILEDKRREQLKVASELAARAREAADRAKALSAGAS